jgi:hypothetical protein
VRRRRSRLYSGCARGIANEATPAEARRGRLGGANYRISIDYIVPGRRARCMEVRILDVLAYYSLAIGGEPEAVGRQMCDGGPLQKPGLCCLDLEQDGTARHPAFAGAANGHRGRRGRRNGEGGSVTREHRITRARGAGRPPSRLVGARESLAEKKVRMCSGVPGRRRGGETCGVNDRHYLLYYQTDTVTY